MKRLRAFLNSASGWALYLRYLALFTLLFLSVVSAGLLTLVGTNANPFLYANF